MKQPVFIIGCPRSGTTCLLNILSLHEDFAWISNIFNRYPKVLFLNYYNQIYKTPLLLTLSILIRNDICNILPVPTEPWNFWTTYLSKFRFKRRDSTLPKRQTGHDISHEEILTIRKVISIVCRYQDKKRFLSKYTDFPRMQYLLKAFPDAKFIHIIRDGRAVAYSYAKGLMRREYPLEHLDRSWILSCWPEIWQRDWRNKYHSLLGFGAYRWQYYLDQIWEEANYIPKSQYAEIRYKDLIYDTHLSIANILRFCELAFTEKMEKRLSHIRLEDMNYKWRKELTKEEKDELHQIISSDRFKKVLCTV